ncbi:MAG: FTR1 family protein [Alphaproteobacteria bacterium]|nr:FTR1 family protein [Alphaproteobacteria bacterium]
MIHWTHWGTSALTAFTASFVEGVEALTIVLAVGLTRGWRTALTGVAAALAILVGLVALFGPLLAHFPLPLHWVQLAIGLFLFVFGLKWLRKAVLRAAGRIPLHDEERIYEREVALLESEAIQKSAFDKTAFMASFNAVLVEGMEVVVIVIAIGAAQSSFLAPGAGALAALALVALLGAALHRPLTQVPENSLKFAVGVLLASFGAFWFGEGAGFHWPGGDWFILPLIATFLAAALLAVRAAKNKAA